MRYAFLKLRFCLKIILCFEQQVSKTNHQMKINYFSQNVDNLNQISMVYILLKKKKKKKKKTF